MQHHVPLQDNIRYTPFRQQWMIERFFAVTFFLENMFGKIHELPEIMDTSSRDQVISFCKVESSYKVLEQARIRFAIINETHRLTLSPVLDSLFSFLNDIGGYVFINVNLCVTCHFENMRMILIVSEIVKDLRQAETDNIFEKDNMTLIGP